MHKKSTINLAKLDKIVIEYFYLGVLYSVLGSINF